jgi:hypothetical protein
MANLVKFLPSLLAALVGIVAIFEPSLQAVVVAHPAIASVLASLSVIISHLIPSPVSK